MIFQPIKHLMSLALSASICLAGNAAPTDHENLAQEIEAILDRAELGRFWGAVVVRVGDETILSKGYGYENNELHKIEPEASLFDIGSISKSITAATILKLIEQDKLKLSTTMQEVFGPDAQNLAQVTVEELLSHQSGLGAGGGMISRTGALDSVDSLISALGQAKLGSNDFAYSNPGYFLLAAVIERVGNDSFENITRRLVFEQAGLTGVGFVGDGQVDNARPTARIKQTRFGVTSQGTLFEYPWNWGQRGATGVVMTAQAAADWFEAIESGAWLADTSRKSMLTPSESGYGFGLYVDLNETGQVTRFWHSGSTRGYLSHAARYPLAFDGQGATVILMTQSTINLRSIARQVHQLIQPPISMPAFAGVYLNNLQASQDDGIYTIDQGLKWKGMPQYIGSDGTKQIIDQRPTLILENQTMGMWRLIIRMDQERAENLIEELTRVSTQIAQDPIGGSTLWSKGTTLIINVHDLPLTEHDSYQIDAGAMLSIHASADHHLVLVVTTPDAKHELAQVQMGGAETRQLQAQLRSALQ
jgi:CubicO group peptidase (beta-lactamase class C family)